MRMIVVPQLMLSSVLQLLQSYSLSAWDIIRVLIVSHHMQITPA